MTGIATQVCPRRDGASNKRRGQSGVFRCSRPGRAARLGSMRCRLTFPRMAPSSAITRRA